MAHCIYSGSDETTDTFKGREHIFPKCIGGVQCLPRGWVSDSINNDLSKLELVFARNYPVVALSRMMFGQTGRKKHKGKHRVGLFSDQDDSNRLQLGYIANAEPFSLNQIRLTVDTPEALQKPIAVSVILAPSAEMTSEKLFESFLTDLRFYTGCPRCIKDKRIPEHTYLLGKLEGIWYLAVSTQENPEEVKPLLKKFVQKFSSSSAEEILNTGSRPKHLVHQVTADFSLSFNYLDCLRVYGKIALNCLAHLKGHDFVLDSSFEGIKQVILTGKDIENYIRPVEGPSPLPSVLHNFPDQLPLGKQCHSATFVQKDGCVYGIISLYGQDNSVMVKFGEIPGHFDVDGYICDWENHVDYTMLDCVLKICDHEEIIEHETCDEQAALTPSLPVK